MDLKKEMVIIDDKIVTEELSYCIFNKNVYEVRYKNGKKSYLFSKYRLKYIANSKLVDLKSYALYFDNKHLENVKEAYEFENNNSLYYHLIFNNDKFMDCDERVLKKISTKFSNVIDYMNKVADITSLTTENGKKILSEQMNKIQPDDLNTALANYLKLTNDLHKSNCIETLIFPFGCNSSQYQAVKNAIYNKVSVIEGPPGTGKTQTILNIIANIIVRNLNCQVVSFNNTAIENVQDKLKSNGNLDFLVALLGKRENKDLFIENQNETLPNFEEYKDLDINIIEQKLRDSELLAKKFYEAKKELANLIQDKYELELEYKYFKNLVGSQKVELLELNRINYNNLRLLWNEILTLDRISFWNKLKFVAIYKIGNYSFYQNDINVIIKTLHNMVYLYDLDKINKKINETKDFIEKNEKVEKDFINYSMDYFKKYLSLKYKNGRKRYSVKDIWSEPQKFLKDYPVILSTTYSSRNTLNRDFKFDYIIMDESSQVDVVTGTLALSSAKYAVIIGDEKQLTNVVTPAIKVKTDKIFKEFNIDKCYSYSLNNFLESIKNAIPDIQNQLLIEHYRCHPKIINFCNKEFYNNNLVIMTKDNGEIDAIKVIKTKKGNHSRDMCNQRQVDEIKELLSKEVLDDVGIIAPYNNQVDLIKQSVNNVEVSTVHKFQGREKNTIIISSVDDKTGEFLDARLLNVAISRAKKHLYFIVTGNEIKNSIINDFIDYVEYNNMEILNSNIYSSFDLLYKQYEYERLLFFKKHNRISKYDSENIIYHLICKIINDYDNLSFHFHQSLNDLINDKSRLNKEEYRYASHHNTHIDFYIFKKMGDKPILAIEVDGYKNHKKGTRQYERDKLKNSILEKYDIPLIRLKTNGSGEEIAIRQKLDTIIKK